MTSDTDRDYIDSLHEQLTGLGEVAVVLRTQRESGMLRFDWPGHRMLDDRDIWPMLSINDMIQVLIEVKVNMARCSHEQEVETGEHIPMGSFTDSPTRCTRCGRKVHHD